jgi:hypothetical protein
MRVKPLKTLRLILSLSKDGARNSTFFRSLHIVAPESAQALIRGRKIVMALFLCDPGASAVPE